MTYLLDSSAVVAFLFNEPGAARVRTVLDDNDAVVGLSVLTGGELWIRLRAERAETQFEDDWRSLTEVVSEVIAVSVAVVFKAIELRREATARLPYVDALIAATAAHRDMVLIHRDPHFDSIPAHLLQQERLIAV